MTAEIKVGLDKPWELTEKTSYVLKNFRK